MDVGWTPRGFGASTMTIGLSLIFLKSTPDLYRCNSVLADPYAHPQHIKVLKHYVYI